MGRVPTAARSRNCRDIWRTSRSSSLLFGANGCSEPQLPRPNPHEVRGEVATVVPTAARSRNCRDGAMYIYSGLGDCGANGCSEPQLPRLASLQPLEHRDVVPTAARSRNCRDVHPHCAHVHDRRGAKGCSEPKLPRPLTSGATGCKPTCQGLLGAETAETATRGRPFARREGAKGCSGPKLPRRIRSGSAQIAECLVPRAARSRNCRDHRTREGHHSVVTSAKGCSELQLPRQTSVATTAARSPNCRD